MRWRRFIVVLMLSPSLALAKPARRVRRTAPPPSEPTQMTSPSSASSASTSSEASASAPSKVRGPYWSAGFGLVLWQEAVELHRGASLARMQTQFKGLSFHGDYNRTLPNSYWQQLYSFEFAYGALKGQGDQPAIPDRLDNQSWYMASFRPGLIYRTSPVSRMGLFAPVMYRKIQWNFNAGSGLTASDKAFSIGLGAMFIQRFSKQSSMVLSLVHQHMWATNTWAAAYNYEF